MIYNATRISTSINKHQLVFPAQSSSILMSADNEISPFAPVPPPATALGRYRMLSSRAGVRVSPLCLGAMSIGDAWEEFGMGSMNKESSFKLLDAYYDAGGNFVDTASS